MGLFALSMKSTVEDKIKCCKINIELFEEGGGESLYLLTFALTQLEEAIELFDNKS